VSVAGLGETTVTNAAGAAAAALGAGVGLDAITRGLSAYRPPSGRMAPYPIERGATVIDDSYNANPISMRTSLEALANLASDSQSIAVVGDMGELGDAVDDAHKETGRVAATLGIDWLIALGEHAPLVVDAARDAGMNEGRARLATDTDTASQLVRECLKDRDWVLVKGSRAMKLERVVATLRGETQ
jgi:UDP-N-acetylmuramoyl-tripeptide--D-alanyl-D-alanine ligase